MSKWEMVKLSEVFDLQMGKTPSRSNVAYWNGGSNKWISIADIGLAEKYIYKTKESITDLALEESGIKAVPKNTVIMSFKLSLGKTCIVSEEMYTNEAIMAFIDKGKYDIDEHYIYHLFRGKNWNTGTNKAVMGATLNKATLSNVTFSLPPLDIQKQIAKTLDTAAELLAMRKQQLAELDNLIKSTFYDMFGDPVTNERGWNVVRVGECLSIIGGYAFKSTDFKSDGIPVIKIGNINSGIFHDNGISYWEYDKRLDKYLLQPNDVVISLTGTVGKDDYANVCILPDKYPRYYLNQRNAKLELNKNIVVYYLLYLLRDTKIKGQLTGINRGIRQANISNADIIALTVPLPPIELQNQFANIVIQIEEQKALVKKAIDETQHLFDSLMSECFE